MIHKQIQSFSPVERRMFVKVSGPMHSDGASGSFGKALVFSIWKGRNYVRTLVTPSNPSSADQITARKYLGSLAKAAHAVLTSYMDDHAEGSQFFQDARDSAPAGQSWISWLQRYAKDVYDKTLVHWAELDGTEQGYFTTQATNIGLADYTPTLGGSVQTGLTKGQQLMALGFFGKDYIKNAVCTTAVDDNSPTSGEVLALANYVNATTFS
jgi:hypothetical protein